MSLLRCNTLANLVLTGAMVSVLIAPSLSEAKKPNRAPTQARKISLDEKKLAQLHASPWRYNLPIPVAMLPKDILDYVTSELPLDGIGAVRGNKPPFRATAIYLGKWNGQYLFGVSEHVAMKAELHTFELGHLSGSEFTVPLNPKPLFSSVSGDFSILKAQDGLNSQASGRLDNLKAIALHRAPVQTLMQRFPKARFFVAGRAAYGVQKAESTEPAKAAMWTSSVNSLWAAAVNEAETHKDERADVTKRDGDVFAIAPLKIMARGFSLPLRDPDGLKSKPFLPSRADWAPESIAGSYRSIGRMSGSPILMVTSENVWAVGIHWTKGDAENLENFIKMTDQKPSTAFGKIVSSMEGQPPTAQIKMVEPAPFAYASSVSRALSDLSLATTDLTREASENDRKSLKEFLESTAEF